tara:strand:- start:7046 stop:7300 length:255 start_codon:yes stop_codon:yes gene_type:complete
MGSIGRTIRRRQEKAKLKESRKEMNEKVKLTSLLPQECLTCQKPFDNTDKKMIDEWYMVVHKSPSSVHLYCPECWSTAVDNLST